MTPTQIAEKIKLSGVVPVFNHSDPETAKRVIKACYDAGLRVFEWTNRGHRAYDVFTDIISFIKDELPELTIGVGSILSGDMARRYVSNGAEFIVSPILDPELSETCKQLDVLWIPGAGTATEIHQARKWGAEIIKIFPGDAAGGPGFVKAVRAPMPDVDLMPTGGVSPEKDNLKEWFEAGVCCVGMGSKLFTRELVEDEDGHDLTEIIKKTMGTINQVRNT